MCRWGLSENAFLRPLRTEDADELFEVTDANRSRLRQWLPWLDGTRNVADAWVFIQKERERTDGGFTAGIWRDEELVGVVGFHGVDAQNRSTSIGYWLAEGAEGQGLMTGAVGVLLEQAFDVLRLRRVEIRCAPGNLRSRAIPERLGFTQEGTLRCVENLYGEFGDLVVYGLLAEEWRSR